MPPANILAFIASSILMVIGYTAASSRVVRQGDQAIVERLGSYTRTLKPGLNFLIPGLDKVVCVYTTGEKVLDVEPTESFTKDNSPLEVDAVVFWQVFDLKKAYYEVEDVQEAISNLVSTTLRSQVGHMDLSEMFSSRDQLNLNLLNDLDKVTGTWGVKVKRVEVQSITPAPKVKEALERERASQSNRKATETEAEGKRVAMIAEAEGKKQAAMIEADATVAYINKVSEALQGNSNNREILQFLITQKYVDSNYQLSASTNSKVIFMDPKSLTEQVNGLMEDGDVVHGRIPLDGHGHSNGDSGNGSNVS